MVFTRRELILFSFIMFSILLIAPSTLAEEDSTYLFCRQKSSVRTVRVELGEGGCRTIYTKKGVDKEIGHGIYLASCVGFLKNVQKNLGTVGWKCRDVSRSKISWDSKK